MVNRARHGSVFQTIIDGIGSCKYRPKLARTVTLADIAGTCGCMEANRAVGKVVGLP